MGEVESLLEFMSRSLERATDQEVLSLEKQMSDQVERVTQLYGNPVGKFPYQSCHSWWLAVGQRLSRLFKLRYLSLRKEVSDHGTSIVNVIELLFPFIFLSTSLPHIVYLYHCRKK
ncbi:hypothetical protein GBAR_LOCUS13030 [Geodia barretti]|uniref:Uncharacterized protein n=1 Tax=Geodia barretti TaxID=519541 RepID=A0AA35S2D9_GEOBA|nr:hypothetical protein GBAR_LOCUS13030 [Geodia barretti]